MRPTQRFSIRYYETSSGRVPFLDWLQSIHDPVVSQRINARVVRLLTGNLGDVRMVGDGVFEMRLAFGGGYRIYAATVGSQVVLLLCGGDKGSQTKDIAKAKVFYEDYREKHRR